ncbi:MAG: hypothetical protein J6B57_08915 [Oscillospiraceae bacterium]|nr:hypothetical protein [Oscillospiraceae bacterium]
MSNSAIGRSWDEVQKELFTPEEIAASDLRVALIGADIKARQDQGIMSGQDNVEIEVELPEWLANAAEQAGLNLSEVLIKALKEQLNLQ